jgi:phosphoserine aminotransferase
MRVYNFSAGPAVLPQPVLEEAQRQLLEHGDSGQSVMEMSHRSREYEAIHHAALASLRRLLAVPDGYSVLLLQGGASLQFSMVPLNLMGPRRRADYVLTGSWSKKALKEAARHGEARAAASTEGEGFRRLPTAAELDLDPDADYVHLTTNNTIFGTQWHRLPEVGEVPLVGDASSDVLCRPVDVSRFALLYAGAQKNLGPAGVTVVVVRDDLLERAPDTLPTMLQYRTHAAKKSLYNTPPTWCIYVLGLACDWLEEQGGAAGIAEVNRRKADTLYAAIDGSGGFYRGTAERADRSWMNVTFRLGDEDLEARFLAEAAQHGMVNLKGHRSVGGVRASIYNAMPEAGVAALVDFMGDFVRRHG